MNLNSKLSTMTLYTIMKPGPFFSTAFRSGFSKIVRTYAKCEDDRLCKKGYLQSPIDICSTSTDSAELPPLCFANHFESNVKLCMSQFRNTVKIEPKMECPPTVQGGPLSGPFFLDQIHFRWGSSDINGSEHSIDKSRRSMEAQLIYYNCAFGTLNQALGQPNGVAIIGIMMQASPDATNLSMDELIKCLCLLNCPGANVVLTRNVLKMFRCILDSQDYYSYEGSITMPPCSEEVLWMVFKKPLDIVCYQVIPFRNVCDQNGNKICSNVRDLQQVNGRTIYNVKTCPIPDEISKKVEPPKPIPKEDKCPKKKK